MRKGRAKGWRVGRRRGKKGGEEEEVGRKEVG